MTHRSVLSGSLALALCWPYATTSAAPVYKWTDAQGTVHYGEAPPPLAPSSIQTFELPPPAPSAHRPRHDYYSIPNQLRRMEERRRAQERHSAELAAAAALAREAAQRQAAERAQRSEDQAQPRYGFAPYVFYPAPPTWHRPPFQLFPRPMRPWQPRPPHRDDPPAPRRTRPERNGKPMRLP